MTEWEARERRRVPPGPVELGRPGVRCRRGDELATLALGPEVGGEATVVHDAVADTEHAGDQRRATREAGHVRRVDVVEADTLGRDGVDVGAGVAVVAVAAEVVGAQRVDVDVEEAHEPTVLGPFSAVLWTPGPHNWAR